MICWLITRGEQSLFNLEIKKKSGSSINHDIHDSKVPSSACVCETTLASFGVLRTPGYTDHSWWSTGSNNCNTINESNALYECHLNWTDHFLR